jgi:ABC-type transport system substrate-binding protein
MIVIRKRLIFWLIKAYIKKSGKTMILSFLFGLIIFFSVLFSSRYLNHLIPVYKKVSIGVVGAYTKDNLPPLVTSKFSRGLTKIAQDGSIKPDIAANWEEQDSRKTYKFTL